MKKFVILDLDGTLIDTLPGLTKASNDFLKLYNYPYSYNEEEIKSFIGFGAKKLFLNITKIKESEFKIDEFNAFLDLYRDNSDIGHIYKGVEETLLKLNELNVKLIVFSNKPDHILKLMFKKFLTNINFLIIQGKNEKYLPKPDITLINKILKDYNLDIRDGIYVGDGYADYLTSLNLNIEFCFLTYGYSSIDDKNKIKGRFINNFEEILNYII